MMGPDASNQTGRGTGAQGKDMLGGGEKRRAATAAALWSTATNKCDRGGDSKPSVAKTAAAGPEPRRKEVGGEHTEELCVSGVLKPTGRAGKRSVVDTGRQRGARRAPGALRHATGAQCWHSIVAMRVGRCKWDTGQAVGRRLWGAGAR